MRTKRDYYEILGLPRTATTEEIKRKYRELARKYHPDVVKDQGISEKVFIQIATAYQTLSDPDKRSEYDQLMQYGGVEGAAPGAPANQPGAGPVQQPKTYNTGRPEIDAMLTSAEAALARCMYAEAENICKRIIKNDPNNARGHVLYGDCLYAIGQNAQAAAEYKQAVTLDPTDMDAKAKWEKLDPKAKKSKVPTPPKTAGAGKTGGSKKTNSPSTSGNNGGSLLGKIKTLFSK